MLNEQMIEQLTLLRLQNLGWEYHFGKDLPVADDGINPFARGDVSGVVLLPVLRQAIVQLNPTLPPDAVDTVVNTITKRELGELVIRNQTFYEMLRNGVPVQYQQEGEQKIERAQLIDFENYRHNRFIIINQLDIRTHKGGKRIPDMIGFVNGLPLLVFELKNPLTPSADLEKAFNQLKTYQEEISDLFVYNQIQIISDGFNTRIGSLSADFNRFMPWKVVNEKNQSQREHFDDELQALVQGLLQPRHLLDYIRYFILFDHNASGQLIKKIAAYHQYYGVNEAVDCTLYATSEKGDQRIGVMWHTQGSGKSISMLFYAGKLLAQPELNNPTIVVVTDRNDLDGQLFQTFSAGKAIIKQEPKQVADREELRRVLSEREVGGVFFTTIQKFALNEEESHFPALNTRSNIIVISDEAHRSQYGFTAKYHQGKLQAGYARHLRDALPNASFIGFTGTPISLEDKDTQDVFGRYVSIYDLQDAVEDGATVPIIYEARQIKLREIDNPEVLFEDIDEFIEENNPTLNLREQLLGSTTRLQELAQDLVQHFEQRNTLFDSKAMVVVSSRKICVDLFHQIAILRPDWVSDDILQGTIKIIMTGSASDPQTMQPHIYSKQEKQILEKRFKDPNDPLKIVIVRDMWLTGFDAPCCNTMYIDKPMKGHNLMQAIARVNRVFANKSRDNGGLIVDYIGLAEELRQATQQYTNAQGKGKITDDVHDVFHKMQEHLEIVRQLFAEKIKGRTIDIPSILAIQEPQAMLNAIRQAANHLLALDHLPASDSAVARYWANHKETEPRRKTFIKTVALIKKGYSLCGALPQAKALEQEIAFYEAIRTIVNKRSHSTTNQAERRLQLTALINQSIIADGVVDLFDLLGKPQAQISLLSEEFLQSIKNSDNKDLWVLAIERYLRQQISIGAKTNLTIQKDFEERLQDALNQYHNHNLTILDILDELFKMSQDIQERIERGEKLGLSTTELAFFDALANNDSAKSLLGDEILSKIAKEITDQLRRSISIDWQYKDAVRARMRTLIRRTLQKYKYPPDKEQEAIDFVLKQAEEVASELVV
ncbi:type I restriction endonuclease subunit R [Pelistega ratti]|uniref:type I restriction endonuclease subunit R n=1 Tax=Pelistega ratti TaxID=2652177 RepID=UPI00135C9F2C|nr:type I restriction endonuclease subunit R [Pelistega ratti]